MSEHQHSIQQPINQASTTCQDIKTGDSARPRRTEPGVARRVAGDNGVGARNPHLSNFEAFAAGIRADYGLLAFEMAQRKGEKTLVIDRDAATVELPPTGNTGVTVTYNPEWYKEVDARTLVDTIEGTFSIKTQDELDKVIDWLTSTFGGGDDLDKGMRGYPYQRICADGARILFNPGRLSQGVHIIVGGEAAQRHALRTNDPEALLITFITAQEFKFKCTRFDLACDKVGLHISAINQSISDGHLVTRTRKARRIAEFEPATGQDTSSTIYIGSTKSDRMVRFYDKAAELGVDAIITRCEVQYRNDYAQAACMAWLDGQIDAESLVASAVDFREVTTDSNVTRRSRLSWWQEWLGKFPRITLLTVEKPMESVRRSLRWFLEQVAPTYAFLIRAMPDTDWIVSADTKGEFKMSAAKRALLESLRDMGDSVRASVFSQGVSGATI